MLTDQEAATVLNNEYDVLEYTATLIRVVDGDRWSHRRVKGTYGQLADKDHIGDLLHDIKLYEHDAVQRKLVVGMRRPEAIEHILAGIEIPPEDYREHLPDGDGDKDEDCDTEYEIVNSPQ